MAFELPKDFILRLESFTPEYKNSILNRIEGERRFSFRLNSLSRGDDVENLLSSLTSLESNDLQGFQFYSVDSNDRDLLTRHKDSGRTIYFQNPSSMLPPLLLSPSKDNLILDLAAAPGSKTSLLAELMENGGHIAAVEIVKKRFYKLKANLKKMNVTNTKVFWQNGEVVGRYRPNHFDAVLLDAPCSSEAIFHSSDPSSTKHWSISKVHEMAHKQIALLRSAVESCKPGGVIMYSTCSFSIEENEGVLEQILSEREDIMLEKVNIDGVEIMQGNQISDDSQVNIELEKSIRIVPNEYFEGFFISKIRKSS